MVVGGFQHYNYSLEERRVWKNGDNLTIGIAYIADWLSDRLKTRWGQSG
jgi:hypothetical protein